MVDLQGLLKYSGIAFFNWSGLLSKREAVYNLPP